MPTEDGVKGPLGSPGLCGGAAGVRNPSEVS